MSNKISEKYFEYGVSINDARNLIKQIIARTNFQIEKEIFCGKIYNQNKIGSLIYKGTWQSKPAVLKIQILQPDIDEIDIINKFNHQNKSTRIRLPKLYRGSKWNRNDNYGYLILEYINAAPIYQSPFANPKQIQDFSDFYQEYKTKCLNQPLFKKELNEESSLVFTAQRISHWIKIAQDKNYLSKTKIKNTEKFLSLAGQYLPLIKMEFMHGHLTNKDIFKISDDEYVLMSNLFWSYRPEFYDTTFHLWNGINDLRDLKTTSNQVIKYIQNWLRAYKKLPIIKQDSDFERKFNLMMAERCLGSLLIDIQNIHYDSHRDKFVIHLTNLFRELFDYYLDRL